MPEANSQPAERKPQGIARKSKRRMAREQARGVHSEMISQFEIRGVDSDRDIAEAFETQRPSVVSVLLDELFRRMRRVEARQAIRDGFQVTDGRRAA